MATEIEELVGFLSSPSPQLKKAAVDIVRGLTGSDEGLRSLASFSNLTLPPLSDLLRDSPDVAAAAAEALINLSQDPNLAAQIVSLGSVATAMNVLYKHADDRSLGRSLVILLANLTQVDSGVVALLQVCGTIRNCCFETDNQLQNLLLLSEYLWPARLLPVAGNKIYGEQDLSKMPPELSSALSHEREAAEDPEIRQQAFGSYLFDLLAVG